MSIKKYNVKLNGKVYEVEVEEVVAGSQPSMEATKTVEEPKSTVTDNSEGHDIVAPLQGNMFNILVKEGQAVKKGDVIAVLEAMKMEKIGRAQV